jgi:hypothetical protein
MTGAARRLAADANAIGASMDDDSSAGGERAVEALEGIVAQLDAQQGSIGDLTAMREQQASGAAVGWPRSRRAHTYAP